jgi:hypothetical protein
VTVGLAVDVSVCVPLGDEVGERVVLWVCEAVDDRVVLED